MAEVDYEDIELHERLRAARAVIAQQKAEIERLREQVAEMLPWFEDIVIGERIRERDANDNGHRTPLGEVAADFGIDLTLDEIERLRVAGDALADALRSGSDRGWDKAIDDWEEARRG